MLNDQIAFGKYNNVTLKFKSTIDQFSIENFYFSSNQGSCSSQVKKKINSRSIVQYLLVSWFRWPICDFWQPKRNIHRPTLHFLCGTDIDNLMAFEKTSDFKNYRSKCKSEFGAEFFSPKNSSEALIIFEKYRKRISIIACMTDSKFSIDKIGSRLRLSKLMFTDYKRINETTFYRNLCFLFNLTFSPLELEISVICEQRSKVSRQADTFYNLLWRRMLMIVRYDLYLSLNSTTPLIQFKRIISLKWSSKRPFSFWTDVSMSSDGKLENGKMSACICKQIKKEFYFCSAVLSIFILLAMGQIILYCCHFWGIQDLMHL